MTDAFITEREFNGFSRAVNDNFSRIADQLSQMTAKLDTLVNSRVEEARVIGEISGAIRSINDRLERQEGEISKLWDRDKTHSDGKLKWWSQFILVAIAAVLGGLISRWLK